MQIVQDKALGNGTPSFSRISGKAVCCGCGGEVFEVVIYNDGSHDAYCIDATCRQVWSPLGEGQAAIARLSQAVVAGRHEPSNVVSQAKTRAREDRP